MQQPDTTTPNGAPPDRAATNRANAQHSTGPRTEPGKKRSSLNALRHGLTGHVIVLPEEDLAAYKTHVQRFFDEHQPKGNLEEQFVQSLADTRWRLNRIPALEESLHTLAAIEEANEIETTDHESQTSLARARGYRDNARVFANLSVQEHRLARRFQTDLKQLRELQAERREKEERDLDKAADMLNQHEKEGTPYDPAEDGFVFSLPEIATFRYRRARSQAAFYKTQLPEPLVIAAKSGFRPVDTKPSDSPVS